MNTLRIILRNIAVGFISLLITLMAFGCFAYLYLDSQLPDVDALKSVQFPVPLRVYTSDGQLLAEFGELRLNPITLNQVPPLLIKAILATEDQRFYEHPGVDIYGLMRAGGELIMTGTKSQGGSTITMQVARNFYLSRRKTFIRKITEILLALKIEREFTKDQILELYLNKIYLGNRAYGVAAAAQVYFGKPLNQLSLAELATIAGLPKAPSTINPIADPIASKDRRDHVLLRMYELGDIDKNAYQTAIDTPLVSQYHGEVIPLHAPYVAEMVRAMMVTSFGDAAYANGYRVYTTINSKYQETANQALRQALMDYDHRHGYRGPEGNLGTPNPATMQNWEEQLLALPTINDLKPAAVIDETANSVTALLGDGSQITIPWQGLIWAKAQLNDGFVGPVPKDAPSIVKPGDIIRVQKLSSGIWELEQVPQVEGAFVSLNPYNGAITSLVGGFDFQRSKYNRVVQSERQPGSGFKPFIYASALARGFTLASVFNDAPIVFSIPGQPTLWRPMDDDHKFRGPTRLRYALAKSINIVSVRLLEAVGVPFTLKYVQRFGFSGNSLPRNLSLALGTGVVTPLELVRGYAVFANGGYRVTPYLIDHITDSNGQTIYQSQPKVACTSCITADPSTPPPLADASGNTFAPQAIPPQIAFLMTSALKDVINYGTAVDAQVLKRSDIAGKTGTTSEYVDTWFSGFNSDIVATAWVGFDTPSSVHEYGAKAALPMWINFMQVILPTVPVATMPQPPGIVMKNINPANGYVSSWGTPEYFREDDVPPQDQTPAGSPDTPNGQDITDPNATTGADTNGIDNSIDGTKNANPNNNNNDNTDSNGDPLF